MADVAVAENEDDDQVAREAEKEVVEEKEGEVQVDGPAAVEVGVEHGGVGDRLERVELTQRRVRVLHQRDRVRAVGVLKPRERVRERVVGGERRDDLVVNIEAPVAHVVVHVPREPTGDGDQARDQPRRHDHEVRALFKPYKREWRVSRWWRRRRAVAVVSGGGGGQETVAAACGEVASSGVF